MAPPLTEGGRESEFRFGIREEEGEGLIGWQLL